MRPTSDLDAHPPLTRAVGLLTAALLLAIATPGSA